MQQQDDMEHHPLLLEKKQHQHEEALKKRDGRRNAGDNNNNTPEGDNNNKLQQLNAEYNKHLDDMVLSSLVLITDEEQKKLQTDIEFLLIKNNLLNNHANSRRRNNHQPPRLRGERRPNNNDNPLLRGRNNEATGVGNQQGDNEDINSHEKQQDDIIRKVITDVDTNSGSSDDQKTTSDGIKSSRVDSDGDIRSGTGNDDDNNSRGRNNIIPLNNYDDGRTIEQRRHQIDRQQLRLRLHRRLQEENQQRDAVGVVGDEEERDHIGAEPARRWRMGQHRRQHQHQEEDDQHNAEGIRQQRNIHRFNPYGRNHPIRSPHLSTHHQQHQHHYPTHFRVVPYHHHQQQQQQQNLVSLSFPIPIPPNYIQNYHDFSTSTGIQPQQGQQHRSQLLQRPRPNLPFVLQSAPIPPPHPPVRRNNPSNIDFRDPRNIAIIRATFMEARAANRRVVPGDGNHSMSSYEQQELRQYVRKSLLKKVKKFESVPAIFTPLRMFSTFTCDLTELDINVPNLKDDHSNNRNTDADISHSSNEEQQPQWPMPSVAQLVACVLLKSIHYYTDTTTTVSTSFPSSLLPMPPARKKQKQLIEERLGTNNQIPICPINASIKSAIPVLTKLTISPNSGGSNNTLSRSILDVRMICYAIQYHPTIEVLRMDSLFRRADAKKRSSDSEQDEETTKNNCNDLSIKTVAETIIRNNKTIKELYLNFNDITDVGLTHIVDQLLFNYNEASLEKLGLCNNCITDVGAKYIANQLLSVKPNLFPNSIKWLNLIRNEFTTDGQLAILQGLSTNYSIKNLYFWDLPPPEESRMINYYLSLNQAGRKLLTYNENEVLSHNMGGNKYVPITLWIYILEKNNNGTNPAQTPAFATEGGNCNSSNTKNKRNLNSAISKRTAVKDLVQLNNMYYFIRHNYRLWYYMDSNR